MASKAIQSYDDFVKVHELLLAASGIPARLHRQLFEKLSLETFDGGSFFQIELCEEGRQRQLVLIADFMAMESDVFLVDHAWTFRLSDAPKQLEEIPGLAERMASLMCVDMHEEAENAEDNGPKLSAEEIVEAETCNAKDEARDTVKWLELEELDMDDATFLSLELPNKFPHLVALSLIGNKLKDAETVLQEVMKFKNLKALWLNDNPVLTTCDIPLRDTVVERIPSLEIFNSQFTDHYGEWAIGFCGEIYGKDNPDKTSCGDCPLRSLASLDLSNRGIQDLIEKVFCPVEMPMLSDLNLRGNPLVNRSSEALLEVLKRFSSLNSLDVDIPGPLGESAFEILNSLPSLKSLNGVEVSKILESKKQILNSMFPPRLPDWNPEDSLTDRVLNAMWMYLMNYRLADEEKIDETSVWYVMDELASALRHSDLPNFRVAPFLYMPEGNLSSAISFSIMWPTQNVCKGDECTRDFLLGIGEEKQRSARLTAWFHTPENYFLRAYEKHVQNLTAKHSNSSSGSRAEVSNLLHRDGKPLRVYTDIPQVQEFLTRCEFCLTDEPKEADIVWTCMQVDEETKKAVGITDEQYINQFPHEACLVMKHHLAETVQKAYGLPDWLQPTYDLEKNLTELIGEYYTRERDGLDNLWILKPWNMARTIDTSITNNLSAIIRLMETGPKICQKYIEHPALFRGKKFDIRYIVLVRSINPLKIFLSDVFWLRLANNDYTLDKRRLYEYETHFTVMNYRGRLDHVHTADFVPEFENEHQVNWMEIHQRIKTMIRSVFEAALAVRPEMHDPKSRAMYGVDVMLDSSFHPKLLEVTYCPYCTRACAYDTKSFLGEEVKGRDFFNNVFGCLFLDETKFVTEL